MIRKLNKNDFSKYDPQTYDFFSQKLSDIEYFIVCLKICQRKVLIKEAKEHYGQLIKKPWYIIFDDFVDGRTVQYNFEIQQDILYENLYTFVYEENGFIKGIISGTKVIKDKHFFYVPNTNIRALYVWPEYRFRSIGSKLFNHMIKYYKSLGCHSIACYTMKQNSGYYTFLKKQKFSNCMEIQYRIGNESYPGMQFNYQV